MKVRMQTMNAKYGYRNFIDGLFKIWNEKRAQPGLVILSGQAKKKLNNQRVITLSERLMKLAKIRYFYSGILYYGMAYTIYISLQFGIHDMLIQQISEFTGSRQTSLIYFLQIFNYDDDELRVNKKNENSNEYSSHWHNELIASFTAGCIAAFLTNGIETVAVNKQTNPSLTLHDILLKPNKKNLSKCLMSYRR